MNQEEAVKVLKELLEHDSLGILGSMSDEQIEAVKLALFELENPECVNCGGCVKFSDEDAEGYGWCEPNGWTAHCDEGPCGKYESRDLA